MINIATDGACKGNPGPGGWGVAVFHGDEFSETLRGGELDTTNNRMELQAFISAVAHIEANNWLELDSITFHMDSNYVLKGVTEWLPGWQRKDFKGVKNVDLWRQVALFREVWYPCEFKWVKGHSGDPFNEMADEAANIGCAENIEYEKDNS